MQVIGIVGGGFSGMMVAVHSIELARKPLRIVIFNPSDSIGSGIAYQPYSHSHLLNVPCGKMGAYPKFPGQFFEWLMSQGLSRQISLEVTPESFVPRKWYGHYLQSIWEDALDLAKRKNVAVDIVQEVVTDLSMKGHTINLTTENGNVEKVNHCVLATGNTEPSIPKIRSSAIHGSSLYFRNPWKLESVSSPPVNLPVLIIGNGLTMLDTVIGLRENGYNNKIYSLSPHGFHLNPHHPNAIAYTGIFPELKEKMSLFDLVKLLNKHKKQVRLLGHSPEIVFDSLRPFVPKLWQQFTDEERAYFLSRLRHLWGVVRHRVPMESYTLIQEMLNKDQLEVIAGKLLDLTELNGAIDVRYFDKASQETREIVVGRVINCTGPAMNLNPNETGLFDNCIRKGILVSGPLNMGLSADVKNYRTRKPDGTNHMNLYTMGTTLRGELWETTAVNELRVQAQELSRNLMNQIQ